MMTLRQQSVNVNRLDLITVLKKSRIQHAAQFKEADADYKNAVKAFLNDALARARKGDFDKVVLDFSAPVDHDADYADVIEMLEVSVDETINLDRESYKAYYRNEWSWSRSFSASNALYKTVIAGSY